MQNASYYREQAERARRLAKQGPDSVHGALMPAAQDFDDIAEDLDRGAIEVRHPERMPQSRGTKPEAD